jgi:hypothetical protein
MTMAVAASLSGDVGGEDYDRNGKANGNDCPKTSQRDVRRCPDGMDVCFHDSDDDQNSK